jgi:hypothetical protein
MAQVRTIWRAFQDNLEVWECGPCAVSVTRAAKPGEIEET